LFATLTGDTVMELFLKIAMAAVLVLLLFRLWPAYKHWQESGRKAEKGDWLAALLPLGGVVLVVILLIVAARA
jgi:archaellum biogenesis protein FlaJ (TadC family)